jgi:hypothetical protein
MDSEQFDRLVRSLTLSPSRRQALAGLASVALGVMLGREPLPATAKRKKGGKGKKKKRKSSPATVAPARVAPPPPPCLAVQETCTPGSCCDGRTCGNNFCAGDPPVCCGELGAACAEPCDCCGLSTTCGLDNTCICTGAVCGGECTNDECCPDGSGCPAGQVCQSGTCVCAGGFTCNDDCCAGSEVCQRVPGPVACVTGSCSDHPYDYCNSNDYYTCGETCDCVTSVETSVSVCTDDLQTDNVTCFACTTNTECVTETGVAGAICVPGGEQFCGFFCPDTPTANFCVTPGCEASASAAAARSAGKSTGKKAPRQTGKTKQAAEARPARRRNKRSRRGRRR